MILLSLSSPCGIMLPLVSLTKEKYNRDDRKVSECDVGYLEESILPRDE